MYRSSVQSTPAMSVITPFFNNGDYFNESARSVLAQSMQQFEWIIVNDGSTDQHAMALLDRYRTSDPRIRVVDHPHNKGPGAARNTGFNEATTPYVLMLDADDMLEPTAAEKWLWFLATHDDVSAVNGRCVWFGGEERLWLTGFERGPGVIAENFIDGNSMVRREAHVEVGGQDESKPWGAEDWDYWLRLANHGRWGVTLPEFLTWYRRRPQSTDQWKYAQWLDAFARDLSKRYGHLAGTNFPSVTLEDDSGPSALERPPFANPLAKTTRRLLFVLPSLGAGGAERFALDAIGAFVDRGFEITVVATHSSDDTSLPEFTRITPDVFRLHTFSRPADHPVFISYLVESRQTDALLTAECDSGRELLRYLSSQHKNLPILNISQTDRGSACETQLTRSPSQQTEAGLASELIEVINGVARRRGSVGEAVLRSRRVANATRAWFINRTRALADTKVGSASIRMRKKIKKEALWRSVRRTEPISRTWGYDRGTPICRYWIDQYLQANEGDISGAVLEVKDSGYTTRFGRERVTESFVVDIDTENPNANIVADLTETESLPPNRFDCFILTQTLQVLIDPETALKNGWRALKQDGVMLISAPVVARSTEWNGIPHYWAWTPTGFEVLLRKVLPQAQVEVKFFGNVLTGMAYLTGLAAEELSPEELNAHDSNFAVLTCARVVKTAQ